MAVRYGFRGCGCWGCVCGTASVVADANGSHGPYLGENRGFGILTAARDLISGKSPQFAGISLE